MISRRQLRNPLEHRLATLAVAAGIVLSPTAGHSAGFAISEWGAHALGMGNAVTAVANTPSAVIFNPAGLAQLEGLQLEAGVTLIAPTFGYTLEVPGTSTEVAVEGEREVFPVPSAYVSYRIHDRVAAGFGVYSMYGLGIAWPSTVQVSGAQRAWWGRSLVEEDDLQTAYFAPTVAVKLLPRVRLGAGLSIVKGAVLIKRAVTRSDSLSDDIKVELGASDLGLGANAGLLVQAVPGLLDVGFAYRGGVKMVFEGNGAFSDVPEALRAQLVDSRGRAEIELPHVFSFGVAAFPIERLTLGLVVEVTTWSSYEDLAITFLDQDGNEDPELSTSEPKDWTNTLTVRFGAEYRVLQQLPVRLGLTYDQSPVPATTVSPDLPDADRYEVSLGVGYRLGGLRADLAYLFLMTGDNQTAETAPLVGTYRAHGHLVALTLGYQLDI